MKIHGLSCIPNTSTWEWRTDDNKGQYYTFSDGTAIHFYSDDGRNHFKLATCEKFKVCKTVSGTRKKLNRIFSTRDSDPTPENQWRL